MTGVRISHVIEPSRCYPGEEATLYTRLQLDAALPGFRLRLWIPAGLLAVSFDAPGRALPTVAPGPDGRHILWDVAAVVGQAEYEFRVVARVEPTRTDRVLQTRATVELGRLAADALDSQAAGEPGAGTAAAGSAAAPATASEAASLSVVAKARSLRYLPALYERDELMGRFLMLFESFWRPFEQRIEHMHLYFDPHMAPAELLPWLASWLGLVLDEGTSEAQRRQLIASAASLYRRRGTPQGLLDYLSILGEEARIVEHRANNLVLGPGSQLGQGVALGTDNAPHTFTVTLGDPPAVESGPGSLDPARTRPLSDPQARLRRVRAAIEAHKPAHTAYTVRLGDGPEVS